MNEFKSLFFQKTTFFIILFLSLFINKNPKALAIKTLEPTTRNENFSNNKNSINNMGLELVQNTEEDAAEPYTQIKPQQYIPPTPDKSSSIGEICESAENTEQCKQELTEIKIKRFKAENQYNIWQLNHRQFVFQMDSVIHIFILILVITIVGVGLYLSYLKFQEPETPETKLSIAKGNIQINSNVIGLVILTISLVFFYLYITHVYPKRVIGSNTENLTQISPK